MHVPGERVEGRHQVVDRGGDEAGVAGVEDRVAGGAREAGPEDGALQDAHGAGPLRRSRPGLRRSDAAPQRLALSGGGAFLIVDDDRRAARLRHADPNGQIHPLTAPQDARSAARRCAPPLTSGSADRALARLS